MSQAVLHFEKLKTGSDMANMAAHNSREKIMDETGGLKPRPDYLKPDEPWPPEWCKQFTQISLNEGQTGKQSDSIGRRWAGAVERANLVRNPQKNAARAVQAVLSASAGAFETNEQWREYLKDCREWVEKKFGHENILQWNSHFDETTPHLHMLLIPIVRGEKNKYSSGEFLGGPEGLREMQTDFYNHISSLKNDFGKLKYTDLRRGEEGSKKKHTNQSEWKSDLVKQEKELVKKLEDMEEYHKSQKELADQMIKRLDAREQKIIVNEKSLEKVMDTGREKWAAKDKEYEERETALNKKQDNLEKREGALHLAINDMKPEQKFIFGMLQKMVNMKWQPDFAKRVFNYALNKFESFLEQCGKDVLQNKDREVQPQQHQQSQGQGPKR